MKEVLLWFFTAECHVATPMVSLKMPPAGLVVYFGVQLYGVWWVFKDALKRNKSEWLAGLLTLVYWPGFLLLWLWLRPTVADPRTNERRKRGLLDPREL